MELNRTGRSADGAGLILVTGGTGTLGRLVVRRLRNEGRNVRVVSRSRHEAEDGVEFVTGDLLKGEHLDRVVDGVATIVHCASGSRGDVDATRNLVRAAAALPRAPHVVFVSIVGADRVAFGYIRSKLEAERVISGSGLPWTILRATQFYDFILSGAKTAAKLPVVPVPAGFRVQPIDPDEVASRLVELAVGEPAGRVSDIGGPQVTDAAEMIRVYLRVIGRRRPVVQVWMPGTRAVRGGGLLVGERTNGVGRRTWEQFLAERLKR
jgi:uncharacterized protein YbjT (DUF2867 family)